MTIQDALSKLKQQEYGTVQSVVLTRPGIPMLKKNKPITKIKIIPVQQKQSLYHAQFFSESQVFHENLSLDELYSFLSISIGIDYKNTFIECQRKNLLFLTNKKGKTTVLEQNPVSGKSSAHNPLQTKTFSSIGQNGQNREKNYIIPKGKRVPFLIHLGVMTKEGEVVSAKYDKFRQINRFLEYIDDMLPQLLLAENGTKKTKLRIVDFGCGKSYLTFAVHYFLTELRGLEVSITGLDLKEDVVTFCSILAQEFNCKGLSFKVGDIATYSFADDKNISDSETEIDLVISLHACDTATDYALAKAIEWKSRAVLCVPCCQHELNAQLQSSNVEPEFAPLLKYGIVKERFAALLTDTIRAQLLESCGYKVQLLEFIDITHTPKNILIRAVKKDSAERPPAPDNNMELLLQSLSVEPTLKNLLLDSCDKI